MAKLHSEIRIKAVNGIAVGDEGQGDKFAEGDIIFNSDNGEFMKRNASAYDGANAANSWDVVSSGGGGGAGDNITEGQASVEVVDTGSDAHIKFSVDTNDDGNPEEVWRITEDGHLLPFLNDAYDIGSAEQKVRDMYISDASLWIGDDHKVAISDGKMKFLKRRKDKIPSGVPSDVNLATIRGYGGIPDEIELANMTLAHWKIVAEQRSVPFESVYDKDNDLDWEQDDSLVDSTFFGSGSSAVLKKFSVAVDNKVDAVWKGDPGNNTGNAFYIDGIPHPELRLKAGTYWFYQRHISNAFDNTGAAMGANAHPLRFYTDEARSETLETNNAGKVQWSNGHATNRISFGDYETIFSTLGNDQAARDGFQQQGIFVELVVDNTLPAEFWYGCDNHGYMGMKIINEAASVGGGATSVNDLTDVNTTEAAAGDALVYEVVDGGPNRFVPKPVAGKDAFICHRFGAFAAGGNVVRQVHTHLQGKLGGRLIVDTTNLSGNNKLQLKLDELPADPYDTMHFEIYSIGTQPFNIEVANLLSGGDAGAAADDRKLHTDVLSYDNSSRRGSASDRFINLRFGDTLNVSVGEGQVFLLFACVDRSDPNNPEVHWYHEIRSGL